MAVDAGAAHDPDRHWHGVTASPRSIADALAALDPANAQRPPLHSAGGDRVDVASGWDQGVQRNLMFILDHSALCDEPIACQYGQQCVAAKQLWDHIFDLEDKCTGDDTCLYPT